MSQGIAERERCLRRAIGCMRGTGGRPWWFLTTTRGEGRMRFANVRAQAPWPAIHASAVGTRRCCTQAAERAAFNR